MIERQRPLMQLIINTEVSLGTHKNTSRQDDPEGNVIEDWVG